jgi:hypothetical protein
MDFNDWHDTGGFLSRFGRLGQWFRESF